MKSGFFSFPDFFGMHGKPFYASIQSVMMKEVVLSPSTLSLFMDCPRCFWRHMNLGIRRPGGAFPSLPSGMDRVLKEHFDKHRTEGRLPSELDGFRGKLFPDTGRLNEWRNNRKGLRYRDPSSGVTLMGALDDLFVTQEGLYAPLDFKTRGYPRKPDTHEHYQHQMDLYSFLLEKKSPWTGQGARGFSWMR
jgi:hypothetical protein